MRLESIKLAGFKSFVDPTTLTFPSNLTAIVGPNGCGKSNIIDAIRWVMGESSAKQLRGQSLDDVIFNGCTTRKPLGQAAVELNFDNSDGHLDGHYSSYAQLSIRREITREGQSIYYLNNTRCRRRDIRDIFLGTGLGPRSYAIIEQGMISRVVEAKPEELQAFIEEAAGISKYKERRRETENRLAHTQENLNRLTDLREELAKQAKHLQRQANTAERYKALKQEERLLKADLHALHYRVLHQELQSQLGAIKKAEEHVHQFHHEHQQSLKEITRQREQQVQIRIDCDTLQNRYYELGHQIVRLEEKLRNQTAQFEQNQQEKTELKQKIQSLVQQLEDNQRMKHQLAQEMTTLNTVRRETTAAVEKSQIAEKQAALDLKNWQCQWEKLQENVLQITQQHRVAQTQHQHYQQLEQRLKKQREYLEGEHIEHTQILEQSHDIADLELALQDSQEKQHAIQTEQNKISQHMNEQRIKLQKCVPILDENKTRLRINQGHIASLLTLQQDALGHHEESLRHWLQQHELTEHPRLVQLLHVDEGWERAVEVALNQHIHAVCCTDRDSLEEFLNHAFPHSGVSLMLKSMPCPHSSAIFEAQLPLKLLSSKLTAPWPLDNLLVGIYTADTIAEAILHIPQLKAYESIITREGVCLGKHWISVGSINSPKTGLLQRERELTTLKNEQIAIQHQIDENQAQYTHIQNQLALLEETQAEKHKELTEIITQHADLKTRYQVQKTRFQQTQQRIQSIQKELQESTQHYTENQTTLHRIEQEKKIAQDQLEELETQRETLLNTKTILQAHLAETTQQTKTNETQLHQLELRYQTVEHQFNAAVETLTRIQQQQQQFEKRALELQQLLSSAEHPLTVLQQELDAQIAKQQTLTEQLKEIQMNLQDIDQHLKHQEQQSQQLETKLTTHRNALEQQRLQCHELRVRAKTLEEQSLDYAYDLDKRVQALPDDADIPCYEKQLTDVAQRIEQIGAVNLAALEEHQSVIERKTYLDTHHQDLTDALTTLHMAIQKMDKETRCRFKETFDKVNENFSALFPHLFSGGEASLQRQNVDSSNSGVYIMAQPPGKRNSSIQLLSGGEKALTATALVFSFFQLNPAPFCMLDEVDAPLDDTNVLRFCKLVREMAKEVQFIFISHNKVAIEMAQHLAGITMHEPGVSRLVAVDVEKAMALAST